MSEAAQFTVGAVVVHKRFGYRGVVVDVDPVFQLSDEWYEQVARSRPPRDKPWYHILVDEGEHMTYVAERHLRDDVSGEPIRHPQLAEFFTSFEGGRYVAPEALN